MNFKILNVGLKFSNFAVFIRFPKNEERRKLWLEAIYRPDYKPSASSVICSKHFYPKEFEKKASVMCLKNDAVPKIFPDTLPAIVVSYSYLILLN